MIFSDLDGTLLDHDTYDWAPARPALRACAARGTAVVLCSSKTRAEMRVLASAMGLDGPLIVENGGAVWLPASWPRGAVPDGAVPVDEGWVIVLGAHAADLRPALRTLGARVGARLRGFGEMDVAEVSERTRLPAGIAALAMQREFSEPFLVEGSASTELLDEAASVMGYRVTRGGRFFHLIGPADKGGAVRAVSQWLGPRTVGETLGFGDAPNDLPLLQAVDMPVIVPQPDGTPHADLVAAVPHATVARAPGPTGWNDAVLRWLAT